MTPRQETPICVSMVICDDTMRDERSKKQILIGVFSAINTVRLPCIHPRMAIAITFTNGKGDYEVRLRIEHEGTGQAIVEVSGNVSMNDPLQMNDLTIELQRIAFPAAGKYWVMLYANGTMIQQRPLVVVEHRNDDADERTT